MKTTATFEYEVWSDKTQKRVGKGEFTLNYDTQWHPEILLTAAREKAQKLAELLWDGSTTVCHLNRADGTWSDIIAYCEE